MNALQSSYRPPAPPLHCESCQYCPNCDSESGAPLDIFRFCGHGGASKFVELRDCAASGHKCTPTAPLRRRARPGQQPVNPRTAQIGQIPSPQPQHTQEYTTSPGYTPSPGYAYGNSPAGQYFNPQYGRHNSRPPMDQFPQNANQVNQRGGFLYERLTTTDNAKAHWGSNYDEPPQFEGKTVYRDMKAMGNSDTHTGNNYGRAPPGMGRQASAFDMMDRDDFCNF
jgi:hypothetical protein